MHVYCHNQCTVKQKLGLSNQLRRIFTYHLTSTLYLSRHFILVEIMYAKQSEFKFLSLPLKSCQNVSQENQSFKGTVSLESVQTETVGS